MSDPKKAIIARMDSAGRLFENILLVTLLAAMMLLSVGQIIAREVFETGLFWSGELVRIMVLWLAMIGAVAACREDRHIRIDAISHLMTARTVSAVRLVVDTFAAVVCATVAWHAWRYIQLEIEFEDTVLVDIPAWLAHIVVPVGFALLSYRFLIRVAIEVSKLKSGELVDKS
jgi:TRAP-type C4-dicarboxylate transport system permease small subunit